MTLRLVLVGWGAIGQTVAELLASTSPEVFGPGARHRDRTRVEIVGVGVRDASIALPGVPESARVLTDPSELRALAPHVVAEAAGRASVGPWGRAALGLGVDFIVSSVSAFADPVLLDELRALAVDHGGRVEIQPGALAGVDALSAARFMGLDRVEHRIVKPPAAWRGSPAEELCDLQHLTEATEFSRATAAETAASFPQNANVAMTSALAGVGPDRTEVVLVADPAATTNRHEITASGGFGTLDVAIANNPLPTNPKSSAMAALALARAITNRASAIAI